MGTERPIFKYSGRWQSQQATPTPFLPLRGEMVARLRLWYQATLPSGSCTFVHHNNVPARLQFDNVVRRRSSGGGAGGGGSGGNGFGSSSCGLNVVWQNGHVFRVPSTILIWTSCGGTTDERASASAASSFNRLSMSMARPLAS